jgi:hypothetical protein
VTDEFRDYRDQLRSDDAGALDTMRQGLSIMARLAALSPDNAGSVRILAWFGGRVAEPAP